MGGTIAPSFRSNWFQPGTSAPFGPLDCMGVQNLDEFPTVMERLPAPGLSQTGTPATVPQQDAAMVFQEKAFLDA